MIHDVRTKSTHGVALIWLSWILGVLGVPLAWIVLLGAGMSTVPRLSLFAAAMAATLPLFALVTALAADSWMAMVLPGLTLLAVGQSYLMQPSLRGRLGRWRRARSIPAPSNGALSRVDPWLVRLERRGARVDVELFYEGRSNWKLQLDEERPPKTPAHGLSEHNATVHGNVAVVALGRKVTALRTGDGSEAWTWLAPSTPTWVARGEPFGTIVVISLGGLVALDAYGRLIWQREVDADAARIEGPSAVFTRNDPERGEWSYRIADGELESSP